MRQERPLQKRVRDSSEEEEEGEVEKGWEGEVGEEEGEVAVKEVNLNISSSSSSVGALLVKQEAEDQYRGEDEKEVGKFGGDGGGVGGGGGRRRERGGIGGRGKQL